MRSIVTLLLLGSLLAACSSEVDDAERELAIVERSHPSKDDLCRAKRKVSDAYLKAHDPDHYEVKKLEADLACQAARLGI